jgi:hypothetical protein
MATLARQRCLNHEAREAVCRCPSCHGFFCRECVALFESRLLCAQCLAAAVNAEDKELSTKRPNVATIALAILGFALIWLMFYFAGWSILQFRARPVASANVSNPQVEL